MWFSYSGFYYPYNQSLTSYNLGTRTSKAVLTNPPVHYSYGLFYWPFNNIGYATVVQVPTDNGTINAIDPTTLDITPVFNSYQGMPLANCDDVGVGIINNKTYIFATTLPGYRIEPKAAPQRFAPTVWRFSVDDNSLLLVIDSNEMFVPNGIRVSPDGRKLYVTNTPFVPNEAQAAATYLSNNIHVYDLTDDGFPVNGRLFALVRTGFANGKCIF